MLFILKKMTMSDLELKKPAQLLAFFVLNTRRETFEYLSIWTRLL